MTLTVLSNTCPKDSQGRVKHYFCKVEGEFVCADCGEPVRSATQSEKQEKSGREAV